MKNSDVGWYSSEMEVCSKVTGRKTSQMVREDSVLVMVMYSKVIMLRDRERASVSIFIRMTVDNMKEVGMQAKGLARVFTIILTAINSKACS